MPASLSYCCQCSPTPFSARQLSIFSKTGQLTMFRPHYLPPTFSTALSRRRNPPVQITTRTPFLRRLCLPLRYSGCKPLGRGLPDRGVGLDTRRLDRVDAALEGDSKPRGIKRQFAPTIGDVARLIGNQGNKTPMTSGTNIVFTAPLFNKPYCIGHHDITIVDNK